MGSGNKPLKKVESIATPETLHCLRCNNEFDSDEFYDSDSELYRSVGKIPYCKECLDKLYKDYLKKYKKLEYSSPEKKAVERICMMLDLYYSDKIFDSAANQSKSKKLSAIPLISLYIKSVKLYQYRKKNYDTTIHDKYKIAKDKDSVMSVYTERDSKMNKDVEAAIALFGSGFEHDDYVYLYEQYQDWTARHECNTKAQEEVFKNICITQLQLLKASRSGHDTKDLAAQLQKWLDTGKLAPKQNAGDTTAENQTLGTLIDKWEKTRPIPEIDEELRDVDKIGAYIDTFFKGHTAKSLGVKNAYSHIYDKFMEPYTVQKPEYSEDEDNEALFDAIFGNTSFEDDSIEDIDINDKGVV